jgi:hypothetical protein
MIVEGPPLPRRVRTTLSNYEVKQPVFTISISSNTVGRPGKLCRPSFGSILVLPVTLAFHFLCGRETHRVQAYATLRVLSCAEQESLRTITSDSW